MSVFFVPTLFINALRFSLVNRSISFNTFYKKLTISFPMARMTFYRYAIPQLLEGLRRGYRFWKIICLWEPIIFFASSIVKTCFLPPTIYVSQLLLSTNHSPFFFWYTGDPRPPTRIVLPILSGHCLFLKNFLNVIPSGVVGFGNLNSRAPVVFSLKATR